MKIAYAVPHRVSGAVGQRVLGLNRALRSTGHVDEVTVLGPSHDMTDAERLELEFRVAEEYGDASRSVADKLLRQLRLGNDTVSGIESMTVPPDLVIVYGGGALYMKRLQDWARSSGVRIAADVVEWYESSHLPMGRLGPFALNNHLMMTRVAPRCDGIVAISTFLAQHFEQRGTSAVVVVPPLMNFTSLDASDAGASSERAELVYCGDPGKKDRLDLVLRAVIELDPLGTRLRLTVAGLSPQEVAHLAGVVELPPAVNAIGRVSRAESLELVRNATWMPLIRDDRRFAHAGFPTKVAEAMSVGTPIIANLTSDLGLLLEDGFSGIVASSADLDSTRNAIVRALEVSGDRYARMRQVTHARAYEFFNHQQYTAAMSRWLELVMGGTR